MILKLLIVLSPAILFWVMVGVLLLIERITGKEIMLDFMFKVVWVTIKTIGIVLLVIASPFMLVVAPIFFVGVVLLSKMGDMK